MKTNPIHHTDGTIDYRYSIAREFCGTEKPQHVLRFCDEYVMNSPFYSSALMRAIGHNAERKGARVFINQPA